MKPLPLLAIILVLALQVHGQEPIFSRYGLEQRIVPTNAVMQDAKDSQITHLVDASGPKPISDSIPATLLWTVTTNRQDEMFYPTVRGISKYGIYYEPEGHKDFIEHMQLISNQVAHIAWKGKPFEIVLESKAFYSTNRNYRLEKQADKKIYQ